MKRFRIYLPILMLLSISPASFTQQPAEPTFALHIEETHQYDGMSPRAHVIEVQYTNISSVPQKDDCAVTPWVYKTIVLRDGLPLERIKQPKAQPENPPQSSEDNNGRYRIRVQAMDAGCRGSFDSIPPGKSVKFPLWATERYDMSQPGTYEITVTRDMDPHPLVKDHGPTVKSNTLTIVVSPPDNSSPPQP